MSVHARVFAVAAVTAALLGAGASSAAAQQCPGTLAPITIRLPDDSDPPNYAESSQPDLIDFFNRAHCLCNDVFAAKLHMTDGDTAVTEVGQVWVGNDCDTAVNLETRLGQCEKMTDELTDVVEDLRNEVEYEINTLDLMFPNETSCGAQETTRGVYLLVDDDNTNDATFLCTGKADVAIDTQPPPVAADPEALPGEGGVVVRWSPPTTRGDDVQFYQVLCQRVDGPSDADDLPRDDPEYQTGESLCGAPDPIRLQDGSSGIPDVDAGLPADAGPPADAGTSGSTPLDGLDPLTVCGTATGTETSIRVTGLENDVAYHVALLSIDDARNVSGWYLGTVTPLPVKDFWEDYHDKGGGADGGLCLGVTTGGGSAPLGDLLVVVAAVLLSLLPARTRSRRRAPVAARAAIGAGVLLLVLGAAAAARAQGYDPYWERWDDEGTVVEPTIPHWNIAFKAGPYRPSVDDEFADLPEGMTPPFAAMFGTDRNFFGVVELERYFLFPEGQLGAYASIGLNSQRADAFQEDADGNVIVDPETGDPLRAAGNRVVFRLVPTSLGAVYRFTTLDDRLRIPIVPYGKIGLSYYLWWVRAPDGSFAEAPTPECMDPDTCDGDRALGASLGWQATVGLAIRAERIDPQAATNLRNEMGIEHAGFFAELMYAKVDGFGSSSRLNVGGSTWLLGFNFEF